MTKMSELTKDKIPNNAKNMLLVFELQSELMGSNFFTNR